MISAARKYEILYGVEPVLIEDELVQDGTGQNRRAKVLVYTALDYTITETRLYLHGADHAAWKAHRCSLEIQEVSNG